MGFSKQLTYDGKLKLAPTFIAGGKEIVFAVHDTPSEVCLKKLNLSDASQERLYPSLVAHHMDASFSSDGRYQCFVKSANNPQMVLTIKDTTEEKEWEFRPQGARSTARSPTITPDHRRVIFALSTGGGRQIASVNVQGQDLKHLTESASMNCWPAVSPDGKRVAFSSSREGSFDIFTMSADGTDVRRLTNSPVRDMRPAWSPDGQRIAFASARDGNLEIYVMYADGSGQKRTTEHPERDDFPTWHPNGRQLLTASERQGKFDLYLIDVPD